MEPAKILKYLKAPLNLYITMSKPSINSTLLLSSTIDNINTPLTSA